MKLYVVYSLELPNWSSSNEKIQHTIIEKQIQKTFLNYCHLLPGLTPWLTHNGSNYPCLKNNFHGPKDFRAIEVWL